MHLRVFWVKGKRLVRLTPREKEEILEALRRELEREDRVVLALVFGSILGSNLVRDVDVAVYLRDPGDPLEDYDYAEELSARLSRRISLPVDVVVLNHAPDYIFNQAVLQGVLIVEKNPLLYSSLRLLALEQRRRFSR